MAESRIARNNGRSGGPRGPTGSPADLDEHRARKHTDRVPPHSIEAEEALLGTLLAYPAAIDAVLDEGLCAAHFYKPAHGHVFDAIIALHNQGEPTDAVSVDHRLGGLLEAIGGHAMLVALQGAGGSPGSGPKHARIVMEHWRRREMMRVGRELTENPDAGLDDMLSRLAELADGHTRTRSPRTLVRDNLHNTQDLDQLPDLEWLIEGLLYRGTTSVLYGQPGKNKSFLAVDWHLSVATGTPWCGRAVHAGPTLYVAAEGGSGVKRRARAWQRERGVRVVGAPWLTIPIDLLDAKWVEAVLFACKRWPDLALIAIDTLSRSIPGANENVSEVMTGAFAAMDRLRAETGAHVQVVHHSPKAGGDPRGHGALKGSIDTAIEVTLVEGARTKVHCDKQKDAPEFDDIYLGRKQVGDSCVLVATEQPAQDRTRDQLRVFGAVERGHGSLDREAVEAAVAADADVKKLGRATIYKLLTGLVDRGDLATDEPGRGKPKHWWVPSLEDPIPGDREGKA